MTVRAAISGFGRFAGNISIRGNHMNAGQGPMKVFSTYDPKELDREGVDIVLECSGKFNSKGACAVHLRRGARKVLVSAPARNVTAEDANDE